MGLAHAGYPGTQLFPLVVELIATHDGVAQLELRGKAREGRPLWMLLNAYGVDVAPKSKASTPPKSDKPKAAKKGAKK